MLEINKFQKIKKQIMNLNHNTQKKITRKEEIEDMDQYQNIESK